MRRVRCSASLLLLLAGCTGRPVAVTDPLDADTTRPGAMGVPILRLGGAAPRVGDVSPLEMRAALARRYRLGPDRRFLGAVAQVHHLISGEPLQTVRVLPLDSTWVVQYGAELVGELPDQPSFSDAATLLADWADRVNTAHPLTLTALAGDDPTAATPAALDRFTAPAVVHALQQLDWSWGKGAHPAVFLPWAARGLVLLTIQGIDRLDLADRTTSQALATVAVARQLTGSTLSEERALLASAMGYTADAAIIAGELPSVNPIRLYLEQRAPELAAAARAAPGDLLLQFLALELGARQMDFPQWKTELRNHPALPPYRIAALHSGLGLNRFESNAALGPVVALESLSELWQTAGMAVQDSVLSRMVGALGTDDSTAYARAVRAFGVDVGGLVSRFEGDLAALGGAYPGPFLDAPTWSAWLRGSFYGGVEAIALHQLDGRGSLPESQQLLDALAADTTEVSAELARWYGHLVDQLAGKSNPQDLLDDLRDLRQLGGTAHARTFEAFVGAITPGNPRGVEAAERLTARLDSRVENLLLFADVARLQLLDLPLTGRLGHRILALSGAADPALPTWVATMIHDTATLQAQYRNRALPVSVRAGALGSLLYDSLLTQDQVNVAYHELMAADPDDWDVRGDYVRYLIDHLATSDAEAIVTAWLARHGPANGFDYIFARTALAHVLQAEGQVEDAWRALVPVLPSWQGGALGRGVSILRQAGRNEEALELANALVDRYPDQAYARAELAGCLWRLGRMDDAAKALNQLGYLRGPLEWRDEVGRVFVEELGNDPRGAGDAARALRANGGLPQHVEELALAAARRHRYDLAFQLESSLEPIPGSLGSLQFPVRAYGYLKESKSPEEALAWLRGAIAEYPPEMAVMAVYGERQDRLLWEYAQHSSILADSWVWSIRAAASLRGTPLPPERQAVLDGYYDSIFRRAWAVPLSYLMLPQARYVQEGRVMLGRTSDASLLRVSRSLRARSEAAWSVALRAEHEGRLQDASDWYRVVVELGDVQSGENYWSRNRLYRWMTDGGGPQP